MFRGDRGLGTSFNSTLLWKLQLPLSRLAPRPHPSAPTLFAAQTAPAGLPPWKNPGELKGGASPKSTDACLSMCARVRLISKTFYMHEKGTLKTFGEDEKPMRPDFNIFLSLHNQDYSKVYCEVGQAGEGGMGGRGRMKGKDR